MVLALATTSVTPLLGQWYATGSVGASEDLDAATAASSSVQSVLFGVRGYTDAGRLAVTGGVPLDASEDLLWGSIEGATSPFLVGRERAGAGLQLDLLGRGFAYRDPVAEQTGTGGLLLGESYLVYSTPRFRGRVGGGGRVAGSRAGDGADAGGLPVPGRTAGGFSIRRSAGVAATDLRFAPRPEVLLEGRAEVLRLDGATLPHAEGTVILSYGRAVVWAGADRWESDEMRETGWYVGGSLELTDALAARAGIGRTSGDPMFATPPRDTWSIGLRYQFADRPGRSAAIPLPEYSAEGVELRIPADVATGRISVAGSFNGWTPVQMTRHGPDWTIRLDLPAGYYELAFVDEAGEWFVPEQMDGRRRDGMGGWIMILVVK